MAKRRSSRRTYSRPSRSNRSRSGYRSAPRKRRSGAASSRRAVQTVKIVLETSGTGVGDTVVSNRQPLSASALTEGKKAKFK